MFNSLNLSQREYKYPFALLLLLFIPIICAAFSIAGNNDFDLARREVLLRRIGHELLLRSGDSTSRVLPVKKISENEYQVSFEHEFTFQSADLVTITRHLLADDHVVNVLNSSDASVTYAYAVSKNKKNDIITCKGRRQPKAAYIVSIKFKPDGLATKNTYLLGGLPVLALIGFIFMRSAKRGKALPEKQDTGLLALGTVTFDAENRQLMINGKTTDLTGTETRLLRMLASSPDQMVERARLQKELWEDEGVIVGRSLDMFISKLRKKLQPASDVNILVVRAKGYKLEIS